MRVFKFYCGQSYYGYAAQDKQLAIEKFIEDIGDEFTVCEEVPKENWDKKIIKEWDDNDFDKKENLLSIRESILGQEPQMIFSNDTSSW